MSGDPFEDFEAVFGLEDKFYEEGLRQGLADGSRQSRVSARLFGIEKGFEKFVAMGELQAKARLWSARLRLKAKSQSSLSSAQQAVQQVEAEQRSTKMSSASDLTKPSARLEQHVEVLTALVDPATLSLENDDDAVAQFDDRLKRAQAKAKIIERMIGDDATLRLGASSSQDKPAKIRSEANMEDFGRK